MVIRIRLARFGKAHRPFYNIVLAQARSPRNSKPMEVLGTYEPIPKMPAPGEGDKPFKDIRIDMARTKYWLGVGAQPSDTVRRLLSMLGLIEPKLHAQQMNSAPKMKRYVEDSDSLQRQQAPQQANAN